MKRYFALLSAVLGLGVSSAAAQASLSPNSALKVRAKAPESRTVSAYIYVDPATLDRDALSELGVIVSLDLGDILTARLPLDSMQDLAGLEGVEYVQLQSDTRQMLDVARPVVNMTQVQTGTGLDHPYTGSGVVVGIVDSGFDYCHPAFRNADGSLRIKRVWEQSTSPSAAFVSPEKFGYGAELTTEADILASGGDIRNNSHGTHVTSIAAGADKWFDGKYAGMAPDADIVLVSMVDAGGGNVCISDGIAYIFDYADRAGRPCVVNISLGNHVGPHDGTSTFDAIADRLQGPGRLIIGAAGNAPKNNFHVHASLEPEGSPVRTFLDFIGGVSQKNVGGEIEVWMEPGADMQLSLLLYKINSQEVVESVQVFPSDRTEAEAVSLGRNAGGSMLVASEVCPLNGKTHVAFTSGITSLRSGYAIALELTSTSGGVADIWTDGLTLGLDSKNIDGFTNPSGSTICEIGGTANRILTVGAYTTRSEYTLLGETDPRHLAETDGDLASFSCYGPTADGRMKPQVTAPGCYISAAVSNNDNSGTISYSAYYNDGERDNFYGFMQGTSMSTPFVTGIVAAWLQAYPDLTPEELVQVVALSSRSDNFTGNTTTGSDKWGYGKIDAFSGIRECLTLSGQNGISDVSAQGKAPAHIYKSGSGRVNVVFDCEAQSATVVCYDAVGSLIDRRDGLRVTAGDMITLDLGSFSGIKLVKITTKDATTVYKVR